LTYLLLLALWFLLDIPLALVVGRCIRGPETGRDGA
jgi:hypothetical protein